MATTCSTTLHTPYCSLRIEASEYGITGVRRVSPSSKSSPHNNSPVLKQAKTAFKNFLNGDSKALDALPLDLEGTQFQKKVWKALRSIPYGEVRSYAEIAKKIGNEKAARAVGSACGKNPVLLAIPCHRVIASNGGLGGFAGGVTLKKALLRAENIHV